MHVLEARVIESPNAKGSIKIPGIVKVSTFGDTVVVQAIKERAFYKNENITDVTIDDTVRGVYNVTSRFNEIGVQAFEGCTNLKNVKISGNVGNKAFKDCTNLTTVDHSGKVVHDRHGYRLASIGVEAFSGCTSLSNVNSLKLNRIYAKAFENCTGLKSLKISGYLSTGIFKGCNNLESIEFLGRYVVESSYSSQYKLEPMYINGRVFYDCKNLKNLSLNIRDIRSVGAFKDLTKLESVKITGTIKEIPGETFSGCTSLKSVEIPASISTINGNAFNGCTNIKYVLINGTGIKQSGGYGDLFYNNAIARGEPGAAVYVNQSAYNSTAFQWAGVPESVVHIIPTLSEAKAQSSFEDGVVKLSWDAVDGANWYNIMRTSEGKEEIIAENVTGTTYTDSDVTSTRAYGYSVQAFAYYNKNAESDDPFGHLIVKSSYTQGGTTHASAWGESVRHINVVNYVSEDGTTSVELGNNGRYFLKEESGGTSAWYAIENAGQFKTGSRFWVRWLTQKDDPAEFAKYYNMLDDNIKSSVDSGKMSIFLTGVTDPDGNAYTNLSKNTNFYVQIGEDWDKDDINAVFISQGKDQVVKCEYIDSMLYPGGRATFARLTLSHFSPYAVFDELTEEEKAVNNFVRTGDKDDVWSMIGLSIMLIISSSAILILNRKRSKYE